VVEFQVLISLSLLIILLFKMPKGTSPKQGLENSCKIACKYLKTSELPSLELRNATSGAVPRGEGGLGEVSLVPIPPQGRSCCGDTERSGLCCAVVEGWMVWVKPVQPIWRQMELLEGGCRTGMSSAHGTTACPLPGH